MLLKIVQRILYKLEVKVSQVSQVYGKARMVYLKLKEEYLKTQMHPNHLELLKAGKQYFKDYTYRISEDRRVEGKEKLE